MMSYPSRRPHDMFTQNFLGAKKALAAGIIPLLNPQLPAIILHKKIIGRAGYSGAESSRVFKYVFLIRYYVITVYTFKTGIANDQESH